MFNMNAPWILCAVLLLDIFIEVSAEGMHMTHFVIDNSIFLPLQLAKD